ncbi:potassium channel family protein [Natranaeroarchaeum sulfidigenes]|uniref:K+ transport system, NAD-binding component fusedto Ion channel n=1 Tax=Natranaeroarchaeum sulfidigenes TaxID=2784880 RepID=A0A897MN74_9EURY|nr:NAD-binding protein [Natranaeroarchaeum sulfidigenes]QSG01368.1 K+ transport system, NAD-binding component fusedto Ion channel [Natranaeroarchaeum sulfidigenes]
MSTNTPTVQDEADWRRRIWVAVLGIVAIIVVYTLLYQWAASAFTGEEISFAQALQNVVEIVTTAGFGGDTALWEQSDRFALLIVFMNLSAVLLVFVAIPLFGVPLLRQALETQPPTESTLRDHVIIAGYSMRDEVLRKELEAMNISYLYVDDDPDVVTELNEQGLNAIVGDPEVVDTYRAANASHARSLVADIGDETNPTVILSARQVNPELRAISVIRSEDVEAYHRYAGADDIVSARQLLGKSLALRAAGTYAEKLRAAIEIESDLRVTELLIERNSELVGQTLREADIFEERGMTVVGAWLGGKFVVTPDPDTIIEENTILLVAGEHEDFEDIQTRSIPTHDTHEPRVVVCGYGTVGRTITKTLRQKGVDVEVIDIEDKDGVDVVGDITDPATLEQANVRNARSVVLSLDEDTPTIYTTLVLEQLAPDVEVIARADDADSVQKLYSSGADFVLSLPNVTGESLASLLIDEAEILTPDADFEFVRSSVPAFVGRSLKELDLRRQTGCTIVAVERDEQVLTDVDATFTIREEDVLIVAGSERSREQFCQFTERVTADIDE